ncbi:MAG: ParB/RepB/Spo0J family partition protein [Leptospiraceae bacterium]|nr:ParB/RepB/Spo0J family partition protein [Leptospiraceae bacterium]
MSRTIEYKTTKDDALDLLNEIGTTSKNEIEIDKIILGSNIREDYNKESLKELEESIRSYGQLQPVGINQKNELIYGFRRYKAIKSIGKKTIKVIVVNQSLSTSKVAIQIIENLQREDLTDYEYAKAVQGLIKELKDKFPYPLTRKALGKKETWIQDRVRYIDELERLEKNPLLSTSKVKENLSVNELKEISSLKDEKKIPLIQEIIKDKSEGQAKTIKQIRDKASLHKQTEKTSKEDSKISATKGGVTIGLAIKNLEKGHKLTAPEKKILKSYFTEEITKRKKEILTLHKEINDFTKKKNLIK